MATDLTTLRAALARLMRTRGITGTCTGGSVSTVIDTSRDEEDEYWNQAWITITDTTDDAAPRGETRQIVVFDGLTNAMVVRPLFSAAVQASDIYEAHHGLSVDDLNESINMGIRRAKGRILVNNIDPVTILANTYAYALDATAGKVYRVELQVDKSIATYPYSKRTKWRVRDDAGSLTLQLNEALPAGYLLRVYHTTNPAELASDSSATTLPLDYLYLAARAEAYSILAADAADDKKYRRYASESERLEVKAEGLLRRYSSQFPAGRIYKEHEWLGGEGWYELAYPEGSL